jgi:pentatricopeptide repeat protein
VSAEIRNGDQAMSRGSDVKITTSEIKALIEMQRPEDVLYSLEQQGFRLDAPTYRSLLRRCAYTRNLTAGRKVHGHIVETGFKADIYLQTAVLSMYCKCGSLVEAHKVFDTMQQRDMFAWTLILAAYAKHGSAKDGFNLYKQLHDAGVRCDRIMYMSIVSMCANLGDLEEAKAVYNDIAKSGITVDALLSNNLIHMYARCGSMKHAHEVFNSMPERDLVSWNTMIAGAAWNGCAEEAFYLFSKMQQESMRPDFISFMSLLNVCTSLVALKQVHDSIIEAGLEADAHLATAVVSMFVKCGSAEDARWVFDKMKVRDIVTWNAMIEGYAKHGPYRKALEVYCQMQDEGFEPNCVTFTCLLNACANLASLQEARWVHARIVAAKLESHLHVANGIMNMFAKCDSTEDARQVFDKMEVRSVISWNTMINGYAECGPYMEAMEIFSQMQHEGVKPDAVTFTGLLKACANQASLQGARWVHTRIMAAAFESDIRVRNGLISMYAKCGSLADAAHVFNEMEERDVVTYNAMIAALGQYGHGREALQKFHLMISTGVRPDGVTFVGVLSACSHTGLVDEGLRYFYSMSKDYNVAPEVEHVSCLVDLLGRAGYLVEAEEVVNRMPQTPAGATWGALLGACKLHGNVKLAERAAQFWTQLEPQNAEVYVSLAHIYLTASLWQQAMAIQKLMGGRDLRKARPSWIEVERHLI